MKTAKRVLALLLVLLMFSGNFSVLTAYADSDEETVAAVEPVVEETPAPVETPAPQETPAPVETPAPQETPAPVETPAPQETAVPEETPVPEEIPAPAETPAEDNLPVITDREISATLRDVNGRTVGTVKVRGLLPEDAVLLAAAEVPSDQAWHQTPQQTS